MFKFIIRFTLVIFCTSFALTGCDNADSNSTTEKKFKSLKLFPQGKSFSGFQLTSHLGETWDQESFKGSYSVVFFGFTNCPDICPTTLLDMQKINKKLDHQDLASPRFIFISVDPDRDSPEVLNEYINFFNPDFFALTGDAPNILSVASQLGVAYKVADHQPGDLIYAVDHASALFILNPKGERIGLFTAPHDIELITQDLATLMESI
ncbi:Cytochrome oxidase biogenesis protein Sco1/SenC/PrrC, thiol-disulfide reductase involved in Cu(I) insertion into CoxII Cu(A) center [hydrothermal vent metagenome]|uniref:Cytochrome oxidase biogenesis protein Sco1/SenC/PrrC, thiol-disulfide reductase involved in Cu(I) insertion into CoxII Cu(A) center n=1 Tax=hydrothermal vent metagenome TaxID=652676 RepID=A0A3B0W8S1_9ZZZZ